jgi:hypothetical protein
MSQCGSLRSGLNTCSTCRFSARSMPIRANIVHCLVQGKVSFSANSNTPSRGSRNSLKNHEGKGVQIVGGGWRPMRKTSPERAVPGEVSLLVRH